MNIRVIGDIRTGKIQPSLTGNAIVDDALIQNFCNALKDGVKQLNSGINVIAEHFFSTDIQTGDLIVMDHQIVSLLPADIRSKYQIIDIDHNDLIRGNTLKTLTALKKLTEKSM